MATPNDPDRELRAMLKRLAGDDEKWLLVAAGVVDDAPKMTKDLIREETDDDKARRRVQELINLKDLDKQVSKVHEAINTDRMLDLDQASLWEKCICYPTHAHLRASRWLMLWIVLAWMIMMGALIATTAWQWAQGQVPVTLITALLIVFVSIAPLILARMRDHYKEDLKGLVTWAAQLMLLDDRLGVLLAPFGPQGEVPAEHAAVVARASHARQELLIVAQKCRAELARAEKTFGSIPL